MEAVAMIRLSFLIVFYLFAFAECEVVYKNFKAYDVIPNHDQIDKVLEWQYEDGVDFWRAGAAGKFSRVMMPPNLQSTFESFLKNHNIEYKVHIEDVGEVEEEFEADRVKRLTAKKAKSAVDSFAVPNFSVYWTNEEIDTYSRRLATTYPQLVQREVITRTFEDRDVFALKISRGGFGNKPLIFVDGGMHAREWVSQASLMYFIYRLVEDPETSNELLQNVDWIIIPNLNPDGYNWAFTQNRLWRQNRNRINSTCVGVDLNRNWGFTWRHSGANTCGSLIYSGEQPYSELEVFAMNNYVARYRANTRLYLTVHSFGDMVLWPWSYPGGAWISNWQDHQRAGLVFADAIFEATGKRYVVGNSIDVLGTAFGVSDDHMSGEHRIPLSFTLELTGGGRTGFDFPESQIESLVKETFWGYRALGLYIGRNR